MFNPFLVKIFNLQQKHLYYTYFSLYMFAHAVLHPPKSFLYLRPSLYITYSVKSSHKDLFPSLNYSTYHSYHPMSVFITNTQSCSLVSSTKLEIPHTIKEIFLEDWIQILTYHCNYTFGRESEITKAHFHDRSILALYHSIFAF